MHKSRRQPVNDIMQKRLISTPSRQPHWFMPYLTTVNKYHKFPADYDSLLTDVSRNRRPSAVREITPLTRLPGMIALATGLPNASAFPFKHLSFQVPINPLVCDFSNASNLHEISLSQEELDIALQYSATNGLPSLISFLKDYHLTLHSPPYVSPNDSNSSEFDLIVSTGSQDLVTRAINELVECDSDSLRKDTLVIESPSYSGTLAYVRPLHESGKMRVKSVEIDNEGMIPSKLEDSIKHTIYETGKPPKCLYLIPTGQNPSGISYSLATKKIIYEIACKYDIIILEDDPYHALQFNSVEKAPNTFESFENSFDFNANPSFQSMDREGRVLRFDSFSKVMSSGMRIGYVSGPSKLVNQIILHCQATHLHTSGVSQILLSKLFEYWGAEQLKRHCLNVAYTYYKQRDLMETALNKYLRDDQMKSKVEWNIPVAGMFYWLQLKNCYDSENAEMKIEDTQALIKEKAMKHKVLMLPGKPFYLDSDAMSTNVRVGFSVATQQQMLEGIKRFRNLLA